MLLEAGHAPGGPEVDHHRLAAQARERTGAPPSSGASVKSGAARPMSGEPISCGSRPRFSEQHADQRQRPRQPDEQHRGFNGRAALRCAAASTARRAASAHRRTGSSAIRPPSAMSAVATQIQPTIGLTIAAGRACRSRGRCSSPRGRGPRTASVRTAGVPIGSRWRSYWFMRGLSMPSVAPVARHRDARDQRLAVRLAHRRRADERERVAADLVVSPARSCASLRDAHRAADRDRDDHDRRAGVHDVGAEAAPAAPQAAPRRAPGHRLSPCARVRCAQRQPQLAQRHLRGVAAERQRHERPGRCARRSAKPSAASERRAGERRQQRAPHLRRRWRGPRAAPARRPSAAAARRRSAPPCGRSTGRPTLICTPRAASTTSGNTRADQHREREQHEQQVVDQEQRRRGRAPARARPPAASVSMRSASSDHRPDQRQPPGRPGTSARSALWVKECTELKTPERVMKVPRIVSRKVASDQRDRPALQHALALGEQRRVQRGGGGQPGQERGVLDRVPGPVAAPAEHLVGPPAAEHDRAGEEDPRHAAARCAAAAGSRGRAGRRAAPRRRGRTGSSCRRSRGRGTAGGSIISRWFCSSGFGPGPSVGSGGDGQPNGCAGPGDQEG